MEEWRQAGEWAIRVAATSLRQDTGRIEFAIAGGA